MNAAEKRMEQVNRLRGRHLHLVLHRESFTLSCLIHVDGKLLRAVPFSVSVDGANAISHQAVSALTYRLVADFVDEDSHSNNA